MDQIYLKLTQESRDIIDKLLKQNSKQINKVHRQDSKSNPMTPSVKDDKPFLPMLKYFDPAEIAHDADDLPLQHRGGPIPSLKLY